MRISLTLARLYVGLTVALAGAFAGAGCRTAVGPDRGSVEDAGALLKSIRARRSALETLSAVGSGMRYRGPLKGKMRSFPLKADLYLADEDRFRIDFKHPLTDAALATLVRDADEFLFVNHRDKTGREGAVDEVLAGKFPKLTLAPGTVSAWRLFLPVFAKAPGESVAVVRVGREYVIEFWRPDRMPSRQVVVDAHSHVPTREVIFGDDGRVAVAFDWRRLTWFEEKNLVMAREVEITVPRSDQTTVAKVVLKKPRLDAEIKGAAFSLSRERRLLLKKGGKIEEVKPDAGTASEGTSAGDAPE